MPKYNLAAIKQIVTKFVERSSGESWPEVAAKLNPIAAWEFAEVAEK